MTPSNDADKTDDPGEGSYGKRSGSPWVAGLVEVKFRSRDDSGLLDHDFSKPGDRTDRPKAWSTNLFEMLAGNRMLGWRPSLPPKYSWSKQSDEEARAFYKASGRDRLVTFRFPDDADVLRIARQLQTLPEVIRANPVARVAPPADQYFGTSDQITPLPNNLETQWYTFRCRLPEALETAQGQDVVIAAIDWGFAEDHEEFGPFIELKRNIYNHDEDISDGTLLNHGTAVLGLAGARRNDIGMVGFAPNATLWAIQAGRDELVNHADWCEAIDFVVAQPTTKRKVIVLEIQTELGGSVEMIGTVNQVIADAVKANVVVCVPAGNSPGNAGVGDDEEEIPPTCSVLVGATVFDKDHNFVYGKDGPQIVVYAPGDLRHDLTWSDDSIGYTRFFGGTSGAVAKVAGAVALMLEANGSLSPLDVRDILGSSLIPVRKNLTTEAGVLLDCGSAVSKALEWVSREEPSCVPAT